MNAVVDASQLESINDLAVVSTNSAALILDQHSMDSMYRLSEIMAKGKSTIPDHLKNNVGDCMAIVMQAVQWRMNPFAVAQKTHLVNGVLGYEAQLVNAVIQSSGVTKDRFQYEWYGPWEKIIGKTKVIKVEAKGDKKAYEFRVPDYGMSDEAGLGIRVSATLKGEDQPRTLDLLLVQASVRNSPLWATDPKQQLAYLAVKRWARLFSPDVILGVYSPDELGEAPPTQRERDITPGSGSAQPGPSAELLKRARDAADKGRNVFEKTWKDMQPSERGLLRNELDDLKSRCDKADTVQSSATVTQVPPELEGLIADLGAVADEGSEAFENAWSGLSKATQDKLASVYTELKARAEAVGASQ